MFSSGMSFGSQPTQGFGGMGESTQMSQAATQRPRQEVKETCLPVTIRAVETALEKRGDSGEDLKFYGVSEPQMVIVVAAVETVQRSGASLEVLLNDATGRMKARWFVIDPKEEELDSIVPGTYVSVFGEVRTSPVEHLALKGMRPVDSADEISYHMIEAAHAALQLQRGPSRPKAPETPAPKKESAGEVSAVPATTPEKQMGAPAGAAQEMSVAAANPYTAAAPVAAAKASPSGAELRAAVLAVLRDAAVGPEGLHLDVIAQKAGGAGAAEAQTVINDLVDDGELFSTITEQHFAAV